MAAEVNVSVVALIVALFALLIAVGQLLQQIFGTADGYRRCQESVIGPWSKKVRLKWRWSQFRFETMFTTPIFTLAPVTEDDRYQTDWADRHEIICITGTEDSRNKTMTPINWTRGLAREDHVGWLVLLKDLHHIQSDLLRSQAQLFYIKHGSRKAPSSNEVDFVSRPRRLNFAIEFKVQSWDFMPPDIVRPLAKSTIGNVIIIAHRLRMSWSELKPSEGIMRADGEDCSFSSTPVRGLGLVLQYSFNERLSSTKKQRDQTHLRVPTDAADQFSCGILPVDEHFQLFRNTEKSEFPIDDGTDSMDPIVTMLEEMNVEPDAINKYAEAREEPNVRISRRIHAQALAPGFADAYALLAPFMPLPTSPIVKIVEPLRRRFYHLMFQREFRMVLLERLTTDLESQTTPSPQLNSVLGRLETLRSKYPIEFFSFSGFGLGQNVQEDWEWELITDARNIYDETTRYFLELEKRETEFRYTGLVAAHLSMAVFCFADAVDAVDNGKGRTVEDRFITIGQWGSKANNCKPELFETVHLYVDRVLGSGQHSRGSVLYAMTTMHGFSNQSLIYEAWWTMMLRGLAWHLSTCIISPRQFPPVPSHFYGSLMPVYIA